MNGGKKGGRPRTNIPGQKEGRKKKFLLIVLIIEKKKNASSEVASAGKGRNFTTKVNFQGEKGKEEPPSLIFKRERGTLHCPKRLQQRKGGKKVNLS